MNLLDLADEEGKHIKLTSLSKTGLNAAHLDFHDYRFGSQIKIDSSFSVYQFDSSGIVKNPGVILLASREDESVTSQILVE